VESLWKTQDVGVNETGKSNHRRFVADSSPIRSGFDRRVNGKRLRLRPAGQEPLGKMKDSIALRVPDRAIPLRALPQAGEG